jgi:hypothetical protein
MSLCNLLQYNALLLISFAYIALTSGISPKTKTKQIMYIVLISEKSDVSNKHWIQRNTLEEARKVASQYDDCIVTIIEGKRVE